ncbi:hypothetical protein [Antarcticimicrobium sediminis]|uniref:Uncharacterized protein n=1 Tax=Antarcticimicrobium sediminis TaxID=2546227 RepID=A0A4R5EJG2_9RHOB|nr:hypothetical protein [Antarcticimicrobium sediminis]TDE34510.1 hypothetical protein E1B25_19460 [Antarcticimicrobium sediminis]
MNAREHEETFEREEKYGFRRANRSARIALHAIAASQELRQGTGATEQSQILRGGEAKTRCGADFPGKAAKNRPAKIAKFQVVRQPVRASGLLI